MPSGVGPRAFPSFFLRASLRARPFLSPSECLQAFRPPSCPFAFVQKQPVCFLPKLHHLPPPLPWSALYLCFPNSLPPDHRAFFWLLSHQFLTLLAPFCSLSHLLPFSCWNRTPSPCHLLLFHRPLCGKMMLYLPRFLLPPLPLSPRSLKTSCRRFLSFPWPLWLHCQILLPSRLLLFPFHPFSHRKLMLYLSRYLLYPFPLFLLNPTTFCRPH